MKILEKIKENKIFFIVFGILAISSILYVCNHGLDGLMRSYYASLYVINYSCGFSSRFLIGSIFSLFFEDKLSLSTITTVLLVVYGVMCLCLSLFINKRLKNNPQYVTFGTYIIFFMLCPAFCGFLKFLGTTDMFWIFLVIAAFLIVDKKFLRWLVPVFCVIGLAIHEFFAVVYLPVVAFAVLYQFAKKPNIGNFIYLIVCALICAATAIYFLVFGKEHITMTSPEMIDYINSRLDLEGRTLSDFYINGAFYWQDDQYSDNYQRNLLGYVQYAFDIFASTDIKGLALAFISNYISASPFLFVLAKSIKAEKKAIKKFSFICCFFIPLISTFLLFMSTDTLRFSQHFLLNIIFIILFLLKEKDETFENSYNALVNKICANKTLYAFVVLTLGTIVLSGVLF